MKTKPHIALTLFLLLSTISFSQDWTLLGNAGTNPANNFVGTTDPNHLVFRTNNLPRVIILGNGNTGFMGLNIPNPQSRLHLSESIAIGVYTQWTNLTTGFGAGNGLKIGISNGGTAEIRQLKLLVQ